MAARSFRFAILFAIAAMVSGLTAQESRADIEPDTLPIEVELAKPLLKGGGGYAYWEGWSKDQNNGKWIELGNREGKSSFVSDPNCWCGAKPSQVARIKVWFVKNGKIVQNSLKSREFKAGHKWIYIHVSRKNKEFVIDID